MASEAIQIDSNTVGVPDNPQTPASAPVSAYKVVSNAAATQAKNEELFAFRTAMAAAEPQAAPQPVKAKPPIMRLLVYAVAGIALLLLGAVAFLSFPSLTRSLNKTKPPVLYIDLGNRRFDPAGLSGRLIVKWEDKPVYELYLDPVDQDHAAGFQSVVQNPHNPLVVVVRMLDSSGIVACQKEIDFPPPTQSGSAPDPTQAYLARTTAAGDTIRDLSGPDGHIAEITTSGPLPCSLSAYQRITAWDFAANFPTVQDQQDQLNHQNQTNSQERSRRSYSASGWRLGPLHFQTLPATIEGDDVVVGDNPARGTVNTNSGREFLLGSGGPHSLSSEWQIFPSAIHYRCEKTGVCMLTRLSSRTMFQARLVR